MKNKKMKNHIISLCILLIFFSVVFFTTSKAIAGPYSGWDPGLLPDVGLSDTSVGTLIENALLYLLYIFGFIAVIAFVIAGFMYLFAAGDEGQIKKAKTYMVWSIVGIVVALSGLIIITAVTNFLNSENDYGF